MTQRLASALFRVADLIHDDVLRSPTVTSYHLGSLTVARACDRAALWLVHSYGKLPV